MKKCSVSECTRDHYCKGLCSLHYHRKRRTGNAGEAESRVGRPHASCGVSDCVLDAKSYGYCAKHSSAYRRHGDPLVKKRIASYEDKLCPVDECDHVIDYNGYCRKHAERVRRNGDPNIVNHAAPFSGRSPAPYGKKDNPYIAVWCPDHPNVRKDGYVAEHVKVMAEILGRSLYLGEEVHHKNGVRSDNRPSNLELWVTSQPSGQRPQDLVVWAKEILQRYGKEV